jgi:ABC-type transport system involved in multi-copper enzyme maturation permease subunit
VLGREFRSRMRGARSYVLTGAYTLMVGALVLAVYSTFLNRATTSLATNQIAAEMGRALWTAGCIVQALLLPLMVPAFTCGAITLERERGLLELLLLTRQSPLQICLGKLGSGVGLGAMLVLSSVPVLSLSVFLGGVAPGEMFGSVCVLLSAVLAAGALGLMLSALVERTVQAMCGTYLVVGAGMVGLPFFIGILWGAQSLSQSGSEWGILAMLIACMGAAFPPAVGMAFLAYGRRQRRGLPPPDRVWWFIAVGLSWAGVLLALRLPGVVALLIEGQVLLLFHPVVAICELMYPRRLAPVALSAPLWALSTAFYCGAAVWCTFVAVLRVGRLRTG